LQRTVIIFVGFWSRLPKSGKLPSIAMTETDEKDLEGHRQRVKERFRNGGLSALADYEAVDFS